MLLLFSYDMIFSSTFPRQPNRQSFPVSDTKVQVLFHSSFAVRLKYAKQIKYFCTLDLAWQQSPYCYYRNNMLFFFICHIQTDKELFESMRNMVVLNSLPFSYPLPVLM